MSIPLPSPFLSPVFSPFSPSPDSNSYDHAPEHSGSPSRKRERVKSFVKTLASPFASPLPSPAAYPPSPSEDGSPSSSLIMPLTPELEPAPPPLRKRERVSSVIGIMKNMPSPFSSPSVTHLPSPSPDMSGLSPNLKHSNHSSPEIDPSTSPSPTPSPSRKHGRVGSFVKNIRRTSSQLFKKDKKDGDATPRKPSSAMTSLVAETLSVSTAPSTPHILRRFSQSKQSSKTSVATVESDLSTSYLEVKIGEGGCVHSPIVEVATPVTPAAPQPSDLVPMSPLKETYNEEEVCPEAVSEHPDPLQLPLPPSPPSSPTQAALIMDPIDPLQPPVNPPEADAHPHDDENGSPDDSWVSPPSPSVQLPATVDIVLTTPPLDRTAQPSPAPPPPPPQSEPTPDLPGPDSDEDEVGMLDVHIPALIAPAMFFPIPNLRLSYFFKPVLTWWLSKDVLSYPYLYS